MKTNRVDNCKLPRYKGNIANPKFCEVRMYYVICEFWCMIRGTWTNINFCNDQQLCMIRYWK